MIRPTLAQRAAIGLVLGIASLGTIAVEAFAASGKSDDSFMWLRTIDGFNVIDDEHIVLTNGSKRALVKTFGRCPSLSFSETIAIDSPLPYVNKSGLATIVYKQSGLGLQRCPVDTIVRVKDLKEARALVKAEKAAKKVQQD